MNEQTVYTANQSSRVWPIYSGVYYDCHVVSIPQVLGATLFRQWLTIVACPSIRLGWHGLYCRQLLDSEASRDQVLFDLFGVKKQAVAITGDPTQTIEESVQQHGYLICRVDSYYHPHFHNDYKKNHSPGHKVTVIDFDDDAFTIIDNNGTNTAVLTLPREDMIDSVLSNLYYAYEKEDTFYRLLPPDAKQQASLAPEIDNMLQKTLEDFVHNRLQLQSGLAQLRAAFLDTLNAAPRERCYGWIRHIYKTALTIEFCYSALLESSPAVSAHWDKVLEGDSSLALSKLKDASIGWKYLKMLCKSAETEGQPSDYISRITKALDAISEREQKVSDILLKQPTF